MKLLYIFSLLVSLMFTSVTFSGDAGEGGGVSTTKEYLPFELVKIPHTLNYYFYLDELFHLGDAGEGGGASSLWESLRKRIEARVSTDTSVTLEMIDGETFIFYRNKIPLYEFFKFELSSISTIFTRSFGVITKSEIYSFHIIDSFSDEIPKAIGELLSIETLDGTLIPLSEVIGVEIKISIK
ncbi:MAG: hypothetical protein HOJ35_07515 [Bdellovibrionales bacterium]|nr:hypothetical protein [Bdellovibrionales bacterium]